MTDAGDLLDDKEAARRLRSQLNKTVADVTALLDVRDPLTGLASVDALVELLVSLDEEQKLAAEPAVLKVARTRDAHVSHSKGGRFSERDYPITPLISLGAGKPLREYPFDGIGGFNWFPRNAPPRLADVFAARPDRMRAAWIRRLLPYSDEGSEWATMRALERGGLAEPEHDADYWRAAWASFLPIGWGDAEVVDAVGRARLTEDRELALGMATALEDPRVADILTTFFGLRSNDVFAAWARDGVLPLDVTVASAIRGIAAGQRPGTAGALRRVASGAGLPNHVVAQEADALLRIVDHARPSEQKWAVELLVRAVSEGAQVEPERATRALASAVQAGTAASAKAMWKGVGPLGADAVAVAVAALGNSAAAVQELGIAALESALDSAAPLAPMVLAGVTDVRDSLEPRVRARADNLVGRPPSAPAQEVPTASGIVGAASRPTLPPLATADDIVDAFLLWQADDDQALHATAFAAALARTSGFDASAGALKRLDRAVTRERADPWDRAGFAAIAEVMAAWAGLEGAPSGALADLKATHGPTTSTLIRGGSSNAGTTLFVTLFAEALERSRAGSPRGGAVHALVERGATLAAPHITGWTFAPATQRYAHTEIRAIVDAPRVPATAPPCTDLSAVVAAWAAEPITLRVGWVDHCAVLAMGSDGDSDRWMLATFPGFADIFAAEAAGAVFIEPTADSRSRPEYLVVGMLVSADGPRGQGAAALIAAAASCGLPAVRAALTDALIAHGAALPLEQAGVILADAVSAGLGGLNRVAGIVRDGASAGAAPAVCTLLEATMPGLPRDHRLLSELLESWEVACDSAGVGVTTAGARSALDDVASGGGKRAAAAKRLLAL